MVALILGYAPCVYNHLFHHDHLVRLENLHQSHWPTQGRTSSSRTTASQHWQPSRASLHRHIQSQTQSHHDNSNLATSYRYYCNTEFVRVTNYHAASAVILWNGSKIVPTETSFVLLPTRVSLLTSPTHRLRRRGFASARVPGHSLQPPSRLSHSPSPFNHLSSQPARLP